jgi:hypothetical protein
VRKVVCNNSGCKLTPMKHTSQSGGGLSTPKPKFLIPLKGSTKLKAKKKHKQVGGGKKKLSSKTVSGKKKRAQKASRKKANKKK